MAFKITTFTSSGTWTIDPLTSLVDVFIYGGGGGGGSGRKGTTALAGGGGGGGFQVISATSIPASLFASSETVTVGAGGTGGASQTTDATNGNPGGHSGQSGVGPYLVTISNQGGGSGGSTVTVGGGGSLFVTNMFIGSATVPGAAGNGSITVGNAPGASVALTGIVSARNPAGGAGGAGANSTVSRVGGIGGTIYSYDLTSTLLAGGTAGDPSGTIDGGNGTDYSTLSPNFHGIYCGGSGGGSGGGQNAIGAGQKGGNGGNGGFPGGGAGGGGGGLNTTDATGGSGAGGNGANGQVLIIEHF